MTIRSLGEFVHQVQELQEEWSDDESSTLGSDELAHIWFRGHSNLHWKLTPKIFRTGNQISLRDEEELFGEFLRRGTSMLGTLDGWLGYFIMQHHGLPTRLLDWTQSALVALFFALREGDDDAAVWAINPMWLNSNTIDQYTLIDPRAESAAKQFRVDAIQTALSSTATDPRLRSIALRPPIVGSRMFGQRSVFTLHGAQDAPIENYSFINKKSHLCRIRIPRSHRLDLVKGMRICGITETTIFPDLDGLARELVREYGGELF